MPLGIDATLRYALHNWTQPLKVSELQADSPYNTRTHQGLPPTPIGNPGLGSMQAAAHPARKSVPVLRRQAVRQRRRTPSRRPRRSSSRRGGLQRRPRKPTAARARRTARVSPPGRARLAGRPQPLAGDAARRCAALGLDGWPYQLLPVPPELFDETVRALPGRRLRRRERDDPAQGGGARARRQRDAAARAIGAANTLTFTRRRRSTPTTPTRPACSPRIGEPPGQRAGARRRRQRPRGGLGAARARAARCSVWHRTPSRAEGLPGDASSTAPVDGAGARQLHARSACDDPDELPLDPAGYELVVDLVYRDGRNRAHARRDRRAWSTAWRSWCVRARCPSRAGQGAGTARSHARSRPGPLIWGSSDLAVWSMFVGREAPPDEMTDKPFHLRPVPTGSTTAALAQPSRRPSWNGITPSRRVAAHRRAS